MVREDTSPGIPQEVHKFKLSNSDSREKTYFKLSAQKHYYSGIKMTEMGKVNKFFQYKHELNTTSKKKSRVKNQLSHNIPYKASF